MYKYFDKTTKHMERTEMISKYQFNLALKLHGQKDY